MEISMNNDEGWTGSGGPWITPELSMQVVGSDVVIEGGQSWPVSLPQPPMNRDFYRDIAVLWINRMIGDEQLPEDSKRKNGALLEWPDWLKEGKSSPTGRYTFTTWRVWSKGDPLQPSGLLGPVTLRTVGVLRDWSKNKHPFRVKG